MAIDQQRLTPEERANLVAYLDRELNEAESRAIATKLAQSMTARREVEALEKTWQLLDHLPLPRASDDLSTRTVTLALSLDQRGGELSSRAGRLAGKVGVLLCWILASTLAFALGYAGMRWFWPDPTDRLVRHLSIAERLEEYRDVESFEFLEQLEHSPVFTRDEP